MIVRLLIGCAFFVPSIIAIKKSKAIHKHLWYVAFAGLSVISAVALAFFPFENLFVTFDSPEAAYEYFNPGKSNIELIVEGENCDFILDRKNDSDSYLIIPKTENGWKIGIGASTKRIARQVSDGIFIYIYQYKNTNEYFITILNTNGGESAISDEYGTEFVPLEKSNDFIGETFVTYYAHLTDFDSQYNVTVNGNEIALGNG